MVAVEHATGWFMPIRLNLDLVMVERKVSLTELAGRIGLTLANLSILKTNKARAVRFTTLEALCRELQCQPGELLEFVESSEPTSPAPEPQVTRSPVAQPAVPKPTARKQLRIATQAPGPSASVPETLRWPARPAKESSRGLPGDYY
jgi:putative transcriptional regulator